ncbi:MAG: DNA/RNA non-specific endonuclease [Bacteroidaceae bacterium]|nr:DNA/RNA non-specific endonuclease [Bacteroidaceae bacterium]
MRHTYHHITPLLLLLATPLLWNCRYNSDELTPTTNRNANSAAQGTAATRLEMPHLRSGVVDMFLVKRTSNGEVNFCIEWDIAKKAQRWTAFRWDNSYLDLRISRSEAWAVDTDIPEAYRTDQSFYSGSGYTRGHICASADRRNSLEANQQTFLYSNMQPQLYDFNGGIWANLEMKVRGWNNASFRDTLYVCRGGTIDSRENLLEIVRENTPQQLLVPKYFFMAILCKNSSQANGGYKAIGFWLEHRKDYADDKTLAPYIKSIDELEQLTGLDFFCNLPDHIENQVEATVTPTAWGFQ